EDLLHLVELTRQERRQRRVAVGKRQQRHAGGGEHEARIIEVGHRTSGIRPAIRGFVRRVASPASISIRSRAVLAKAPASLPIEKAEETMRRKSATMAALGGLILIAANASAQDSRPYAILELGHLGPGNSYAWGISDAGHVAGSSSAPGALHAYVWFEGVMTDVGSWSGPVYSKAWDVNNLGHVCGYFGGFGDHHACLWRDGERIDLGTLGGFKSEAYGINDLGQVAGYSEDNPADRFSGAAVVWDADGTAQVLPKWPGGKTARAYDINNAGQAVGYAYDLVNSDFRAVLWEPDGTLVDLGLLSNWAEAEA